MIPRQYLERPLPLVGKTDKVLDDFKQPRWLKKPLEKRIKLGIRRIFIAAIYRLPRHKAFLVGRDRPRLRRTHITHHTNRIVDEE